VRFSRSAGTRRPHAVLNKNSNRTDNNAYDTIPFLSFLFGAGGESRPMTYKIKRLARISAVVLGIIVVSVSVGAISALYLTEFAINHHKDPSQALTFANVITVILLFGGIGGFLTAVWRVEAQARRRLS
jgi:hypothetical protein